METWWKAQGIRKACGQANSIRWSSIEAQPKLILILFKWELHFVIHDPRADVGQKTHNERALLRRGFYVKFESGTFGVLSHAFITFKWN